MAWENSRIQSFPFCTYITKLCMDRKIPFNKKNQDDRLISARTTQKEYLHIMRHSIDTNRAFLRGVDQPDEGDEGDEGAEEGGEAAQHDFPAVHGEPTMHVSAEGHTYLDPGYGMSGSGEGSGGFATYTSGGGFGGVGHQGQPAPPPRYPPQSQSQSDYIASLCDRFDQFEINQANMRAESQSFYEHGNRQFAEIGQRAENIDIYTHEQFNDLQTWRTSYEQQYLTDVEARRAYEVEEIEERRAWRQEERRRSEIDRKYQQDQWDTLNTWQTGVDDQLSQLQQTQQSHWDWNQQQWSQHFPSGGGGGSHDGGDDGGDDAGGSSHHGASQGQGGAGWGSWY